MDSSLIKSIVKGASVSFVGMALLQLGAFLYKILMARLLLPSDYGLFFLTFSFVISVLLFAVGGFPEGALRFVAFYRGKKDQNRILGIIFDSTMMVLVMSVLAAAFVVIFATDIASFFGKPAMAPLLTIMAFFIPLEGLSLCYRKIADGFRAVKYGVYVEVVAILLPKLLLTAVVLFLGLGVLGASYALIIAYGLGLLVILYFVQFKLFKVFNSKIKIIRETREYLSFSFPLFISTSVLAFISRIGVLAVGFYMTQTDVGLFEAAFALSVIPLIFLNSFNRIFNPIASELFAKNMTREVKSLFKTITKWSIILTLPFSTIFVLFSKSIISFVFGTLYAGGATALTILSIGYFIDAAGGSNDLIITASGRSKLVLLNKTLLFILLIVLSIVLIPPYGLVGAALAIAISRVFINGLSLAEIWFKMGMHPFRLKLIKPLAANTIAIVAVYLMLKYFFPVTSFLVAVIAVICFFVLYAFLFWILGTADEEDLLVLEAVEKKLGIGNQLSELLSIHPASMVKKHWSKK